jgi:hypothetical protein
MDGQELINELQTLIAAKIEEAEEAERWFAYSRAIKLRDEANGISEAIRCIIRLEEC